MLDVEQPDPGAPASSAAGAHRSRKSPIPIAQNMRGGDRSQREVGPEHAVAHPGRRVARDDPRADDHREHRPQAEHDHRVADDPVAESTPPRPLSVLGDGQCREVANAPFVQITRGRVVNSVVVAPANERREDEQPAERAEPRVGSSGREK